MTERQRRMAECVENAIYEFNAYEQYLIDKDVSERCICAKFMGYLERAIASSEFREYTVDVEYNRGGHGNEYAAKELDGRNIVVDLIVHKRGYAQDRGFDNLICIEMKKAYKHPDMTADKARLRVMTTPYCGFGYKAGFMIVADADRCLSKYGLRIEDAFYNWIDEEN